MEDVQKYEEKSLARYSDFDLAAIQDMVAEYQALTVPEGDDDAFRVARKALTTCVRTRTAIEKHRKGLGRDLRAQLADINDTGKFLVNAIAPAEEHLSTEVYREKNRLKEIEDEKERLKKEATGARVEELSGYLPYTPLPPYSEIESMSDGQFQVAAKSAKFVFDTEQERIAEEKRLEDERLAKVAAEQQAERERLANERKAQEEEMANVKAEQDRIVAEQAEALAKIDAENARVAAELKAKQSDIDAKEKAIQDEKDRIDRVEFEKKAKEDARIQAEADAKAAAEKAEAEKKALEAAEVKEANRVEGLKPDREKALDWIDCAGQTPEFPTVISDLEHILEGAQTHIEVILNAAAKQVEEFCDPHDTITGD